MTVAKSLVLSVLIFVGAFLSVFINAYADTNLVVPFTQKLETSISNKRVLLVKSGEAVTKFRVKDLEQLSLYEASVPPIWVNEAGKYQGVLLLDILKAADMDGVKRVKLVALNGYAIDLALSKWPGKCLFIATRHLMREIRVEMKGPTRLLIPCMIDPDGKNYAEISTANWIWNLKEIHVLD
ncbi:hypothetical protein WH95_16505 [Kiloniella litopenaei]|uniref:Oxidoreductase molybdopterin-binding domain-containing protein n=1 Tax=Kiloniella litopenaei TaxID=1549748 RepID=A0A0M2R5V1_9PROT|nr:hypothetical protein WH95_16505 [Kiloniella litopenaei]